jgi:hypothetical protein
VIGRTSKTGNTDTFNSQPPPLLASANTIKLYKIKRIVWVKKNKINIINTIEVLSNNSNNNKNNNNPLLNTSDKAKNNFKDHTHNKEENNPNTIFFRYIYVYISSIYPI